MSSPLHERVREALKTHLDQVKQVALDIHARPELRYEEFYASQHLAESLLAMGLPVEKPFGKLETAFCARMGNASLGPRVAILAEYDALPEIGHACGHNLIATAALGAGLALASVRDELPGEILIMGTPAEEGGGGKIKLIEAGAFDGVDAAMMFHPFDQHLLGLDSLAMHVLQVDFVGQPSHAAVAPWEGKSALSGVIQTFNLVDASRIHFRDGTRVHGIITNGGQAVNIIPEKASARFSVRARTAAYLDEVVMPQVMRCAEAAALATGTEVTLRIERGYKNMVNNWTLAQRFGSYLEAQDVKFLTTDPHSGIGSTDMGDVSQVVPSIHPYLAICAKGESLCHQHSFARLAGSEQGLATMKLAAESLALTALDILLDADLRAALKAEFDAQQV
jgi:amidohydrolase